MWADFITSGIKYEDDNPFKQKYFIIKFINIVCMVAILAFTAFVASLWIPGRDQPHWSLFVSIAITLFLIMLTMVMLRRNKNVNFASSLLIITLFFINAGHTFYTNRLGEDTDDIIVTLIIAPVIIFILKGTKRGLIWVFLFVLFTMFMMIIRPALYYELDSRLLDIMLTIFPSIAFVAIYIYVNERFAEIAERNKEELVKVLEKEQELIKSKEIFVNIAAHKLRTPISIMRGAVEKAIVQQNEASPALHDSLLSLQKTSDRMQRVVNEILTVFEIDKVQIMNKIEPVNVEELVHHVVDGLKEEAEMKSISIEIHPSTSPIPEIMTDFSHISEAVRNVVQNSIDYSEKEGKVDIFISQSNDRVIIIISDEGIGIPAIVQEVIFSKFFRFEKAVLKKPDGSGLGLYIAKSYINRLGGNIHFTSPKENGKGTQFTIELPLKTEG